MGRERVDLRQAIPDPWEPEVEDVLDLHGFCVQTVGVQILAAWPGSYVT